MNNKKDHTFKSLKFKTGRITLIPADAAGVSEVHLHGTVKTARGIFKSTKYAEVDERFRFTHIELDAANMYVGNLVRHPLVEFSFDPKHKLGRKLKHTQLRMKEMR